MKYLDNQPKTDPQKGKENKPYLAVPFFVALAVLTVVAFIIPLRPTQSQMEKRNLAEFPEFSWKALGSGEYFDDISLWFSDTFPGRESWLMAASRIEELHGSAGVSLSGDSDEMEQISVPTVPSAPTSPTNPTDPTGTQTQQPDPTEETDAPTQPTEKPWGGLDLSGDVKIEMNGQGVIQIDGHAFNQVGFSQYCSDWYVRTLNRLAENLAADGVKVVSAPCPTSVSIMIEPEYLGKLKCADQNQIIQYLHGTMDERIVKVDTFDALVNHNDEYIYFRTDHHWTARGAYYAYEAICRALGYEPVPLEELDTLDMGDFEGSVYWKAPRPRSLEMDNLTAYMPKGDLELRIRGMYTEGQVQTLIRDFSESPNNAKYNAFLYSDNALSVVTNYDLPDGPTCIVIKDSFGNALVPFLAQNYSKVYAIDYRKFGEAGIQGFLKVFPVDEVIFAPYVLAIQDIDGNKMFENLAGR